LFKKTLFCLPNAVYTASFQATGAEWIKHCFWSGRLGFTFQSDRTRGNWCLHLLCLTFKKDKVVNPNLEWMTDDELAQI